MEVGCTTNNDVAEWEWAGSAYDEGLKQLNGFHIFGVPNSAGALQRRCKPLFLTGLPIYLWSILLDEILYITCGEL
jgi:hypothetical protein